ncbi:kynurenine formamidase-like [Panulirus ornatus]|uniref:kynurenine formamidase-like n=1 Tax=Panulirus ornatus TaxID=150431 RepID=UPI003A8BD8B7
MKRYQAYTFLTLGTTAIILTVACVDFASSELVELSYTYNVDAPTSPKLNPFNFSVLQKGFNDKGIWVELNEFCSSEHSGTHVDAPVHFSRGSWTIDEIPLDRLWNVPGVVIDVTQAIERSSERNYHIQVKDLEKWEEEHHGYIPDGAVVLIHTGWGKMVKDLQEYSGLDEERSNNFPGLSEEAAIWLATYGQRNGYSKGVVGVGVDTISVDVGNSTLYPVHRALYSHNIYGIENMANLDKLLGRKFELTILPMRIGGGSGAPARIIASVREKQLGHVFVRSASTALPRNFFFLLATTVILREFLKVLTPTLY